MVCSFIYRWIAIKMSFQTTFLVVGLAAREPQSRRFWRKYRSNLSDQQIELTFHFFTAKLASFDSCDVAFTLELNFIGVTY